MASVREIKYQLDTIRGMPGSPIENRDFSLVHVYIQRATRRVKGWAGDPASKIYDPPLSVNIDDAWEVVQVSAYTVSTAPGDAVLRVSDMRNTLGNIKVYKRLDTIYKEFRDLFGDNPRIDLRGLN